MLVERIVDMLELVDKPELVTEMNVLLETPNLAVDMLKFVVGRP